MLFGLHYHYTGDTQYRDWFDLDNSLTRWKKNSKILKNSQFAKFAKFRMKTQLFPRHAPPILFCCTLLLHWWYSIPCLVWFGQLLDPMKKKIFKTLKNSQFAKFAKFRMKNHFFLGKLYQQLFCFTLSLHWWYSMPSLVWFGQLLDPMKKNFLRTLNNSQFAKFAEFRMKNHFFPRQATPTTFWLYTVIKLVILNTEIGWVWKTPCTDEKDLFLKFLLREVQKVLYESPIFFLGKLNQCFLLYTIITLVILNTEFCLIWATPWPDEKQLFLKFSKIRILRNPQNFVWKTIFFQDKLYQQLFSFTLSLHSWYSIPSLVWFGRLLVPMKKTFF